MTGKKRAIFEFTVDAGVYQCLQCGTGSYRGLLHKSDCPVTEEELHQPMSLKDAAQRLVSIWRTGGIFGNSDLQVLADSISVGCTGTAASKYDNGGIMTKLVRDEDGGFLCAGECAHYIIEHQRRMELDRQIDRLARFIMDEIPLEPSESQGAVDTAIRWMRSKLVRA